MKPQKKYGGIFLGGLTGLALGLATLSGVGAQPVPAPSTFVNVVEQIGELNLLPGFLAHEINSYEDYDNAIADNLSFAAQTAVYGAYRFCDAIIGGISEACANPVNGLIENEIKNAFLSFVFNRVRVEFSCKFSRATMYHPWASGTLTDDGLAAGTYRVNADVNMIGDSLSEFGWNLWPLFLGGMRALNAGFYEITSDNLQHWLHHCAPVSGGAPAGGEGVALAPRSMVMVGGNDFHLFRTTSIAHPYLLPYRRNNIANNLHRIATWHAVHKKKLILLGNLPTAAKDPTLRPWLWMYEFIDAIGDVPAETWPFVFFLCPQCIDWIDSTASYIAWIDSTVNGDDTTFESRQMWKMQPLVTRVAEGRKIPRLELWNYFQHPDLPYHWVADPKYYYNGPPSNLISGKYDGFHLTLTQGYPRLGYAILNEMARDPAVGLTFMDGPVNAQNTSILAAAGTAGIPTVEEPPPAPAAPDLTLILLCFLVGICAF